MGKNGKGVFYIVSDEKQRTRKDFLKVLTRARSLKRVSNPILLKHLIKTIRDDIDKEHLKSEPITELKNKAQQHIMSAQLLSFQFTIKPGLDNAIYEEYYTTNTTVFSNEEIELVTPVCSPPAVGVGGNITKIRHPSTPVITTNEDPTGSLRRILTVRNEANKTVEAIETLDTQTEFPLQPRVVKNLVTENNAQHPSEDELNRRHSGYEIEITQLGAQTAENANFTETSEPSREVQSPV